MGNADSHEYLPVWDPEHKILDLKHVLNVDEYNKHVRGHCNNNECLDDLPSHILEEISLYETFVGSFNQLTSIPSVLPLHLPHLNHIDLSHNQLIEIPRSICLFFHLRILLLHHNRLQHVPESLTNLHKLEKLDLSHNKLSELPEDFCSLKELRKLNVSYNRLRRLPWTLVRCDNLKIVLAVGNKCETPPQDVCDGGSQEILNYIKKSFSTSETSSEEKGNTFLRVRQNQLQSPSLDPNSTKVQYVQQKTATENVALRIKTPLLFCSSATTFSLEDFKDKILGLIHGAVVGDALGVATEFMTMDESYFHYDEDKLDYSNIVVDEHRLHWQHGQWTSISDVMLLVLDSVIHWAGVVDELDFAQRLVNWKNDGLLNDGHPGYTTSSVINQISSCDDFARSPHTVAASLLQPECNGICTVDQSITPKDSYLDSSALPASVILGIIHFHNLSEVVSNSDRICKATHADPRCRAASIVVSCIVALLLQGNYRQWVQTDMQDLCNIARMLAVEKLSDVDQIKQFNKCFTDLNLSSVFQGEHDENHPFTTLKISLAALCSCADYKDALAKIIMQGGPSTVRANVAGAFLGCVVGYKKLTSEWIRGLHAEQTEWLNSRINVLLDMMGIP